MPKDALKTLKETILYSKKKEAHVEKPDRSQNNNTIKLGNRSDLNSTEKVTNFHDLISNEKVKHL